jgi:hypothetical protein
VNERRERRKERKRYFSILKGGSREIGKETKKKEKE